MFISHDLKTVRAVCDDIMVVYAGRVAEVFRADTLDVPHHHPYTQLLRASVPHLRPGWLEQSTSSAREAVRDLAARQAATCRGPGSREVLRQCRTALLRGCPLSIPDEDRFCSECGASLSPSRVRPATFPPTVDVAPGTAPKRRDPVPAERRQITVLPSENVCNRQTGTALSRYPTTYH
jgi:hypothetical protein